MAEPSLTFQAQLRTLREAFTQGIPARIAELEKAWTDPNRDDASRVALLRQLAHRLGGTAGTFGFTPLAEAAQELESLARAHSLAEGAQSEALRSLLEEHLLLLRQAGEDALQPYPLVPGTALAAPLEAEGPSVAEAFLLHPGPERPDWVTQLSAFGFPCREFQDWATFAAALQAVTPPVAVIDDAALPGSPTAPGPLLELQTTRRRAVPLIMLSDWPDLESRVHAVRAGSRAYLPKPPDILALVEAVEAHSQQTQNNPLTVLVVEDDPLQANHHATLLRSAGMNALVENDPLRVMEPLVDGRPDLVLMDLYMPGCSRHRAGRRHPSAGGLRRHPHRIPLPGAGPHPPVGGHAPGRRRLPHQAGGPRAPPGHRFHPGPARPSAPQPHGAGQPDGAAEP